MAESYSIFDRQLVRERAKASGSNADYLFVEGAQALNDRLSDINRAFKAVLAFGPGLDGGFFKTRPKKLIFGQDEELLDFPENSFDLVISNLTLHWVNDLPGTLVQIRRALKPDGLFLSVMFGGETLGELKQALLMAETEIKGGASPRVSPFVEIKDAGHLLQRAGFAMPVVDMDKLTVSYDHPLKLMSDLRAMGENNALLERQKSFTGRKTLTRAAEIYQERFSDDEGRIFASFHFLHMSGWAPGPNQPKPLKPGSATVDLRDVLAKKKV
ncbi:MAG: methyltransferase domain-containing protein [Alphaproteobacteria bacterium]